jgi:hypothetical protein
MPTPAACTRFSTFAVYDSVNGIRGHAARAHALVQESGPMRRILRPPRCPPPTPSWWHSTPTGRRLYDDTLAADLAGIHSGSRRGRRVAWGQHVGQLVVAARADDGSTPGRDAAGRHRSGQVPVGVVRRAVPQRASVRGRRRDPVRLGPPPALDSLDYAAAFAEVALLGNAAIAAPDKLATFQYWSLPAGSDQPPGSGSRSR